MKRFHSIILTVFAKHDEDEIAIADRLKALIPFDLTQEKLAVKRERATSAENFPIHILSITLEREKHCEEFAAWLGKTLTPAQKQLLIDQAPTRLDQGLNFFIRFDKQHWMDGELQITDSGNCFHCKMSLAAYPAKWERGLAIIKHMLV